MFFRDGGQKGYDLKSLVQKITKAQHLTFHRFVFRDGGQKGYDLKSLVQKITKAQQT